MSKDFDTTLSTAIDLAAGAAQTAGAQAARIRGRKRAMRKRAAVTAMSLVVVAAGAATAFEASSSNNGGTPKMTTTTTNCTTQNPSSSANSYSGAVDSLLLPIPAGDTRLNPRQGTSGGQITLDQYVGNDYPGDNALQANATKSTLAAFGFESAAVQWYHDPQGDDIESYLIQFSSAQGAQGYGLSLASSRMQNAGATKFPDSTAATGYGFSVPASNGYTENDLFGYAGNVLVIVHVYTQGGAQASTAASAFASQYSAVRNAQH